MDANIDPSITELDLLHVSSSSLERPRDSSPNISLGVKDVESQDPGANLTANVFHLNEYVGGGGDHEDDTSTATAALNMIQFNNFEENHLPSTDLAAATTHYYPEYYNESLAETPSTTITSPVVQYNPDEKTKRLGRPRKHLYTRSGSLETSSSQNLNESVISKFRFDTQPIAGPGSRGGRLISRQPRGKITSGTHKRKLQAQLNFSVEKSSTSDHSLTKRDVQEDIRSGITSDVPSSLANAIDLDSTVSSTNHTDIEQDTPSQIPSPRVIENSNMDIDAITANTELIDQLEEVEPSNDHIQALDNEDENQEIDDTSNDTNGIPVDMLLNEDKTASSVEIKRSNGVPRSIVVKLSKPADEILKTLKKAPVKRKRSRPGKKAQSLLTTTSRTTVANNTKRVTRQLPGPLVGLHYDLYDDNIIRAEANTDAQLEKIALGFPVIRSPLASDILFIVSFLNKFSSILKIDDIGPLELENGLSLKNPFALNEVANPEYTPEYVSPQMEHLFARLVSLVLNRKKEITSISNAISDLKNMNQFLGLPKEWKEVEKDEDEEVKEEPGSPVDPNKPEILPIKPFVREQPKYKFNPFQDPDFEKYGLKGIKDPTNRLILLRATIQWALSTSEILKNYIFQSVQNQDIPGDKETYYAARSVLKGFKNAEETKRLAEAKLAKRDDDVKYYDPTSNPLDHSYRIRLSEELAGDIGFHIGRFYLCRMANEYSGGLASIKKMHSVWNGPVVAMPSSFKLYVHDVHQSLVDGLTNDGVEFDQEGNEIKRPKVRNNSKHNWYELASNGQELSMFVDFLAKRLGLTVSEQRVKIIPMTSTIHKSVSNLHGYLSALLPLILQQESVNFFDKRSTRHKINYSDKNASKNFLLEDDFPKENENENDEDYLEEAEEVQLEENEDDDYVDEE